MTYAKFSRSWGQNPSVVSREVARHGGRDEYRALAAHEAARAAWGRLKRFAVQRSPGLRVVVCWLLRGGWFPGLDRGPVADRLRR